MTRANAVTARYGATLLELVVCAAILGILGSVATLVIHRPLPLDHSDPLTIVADTLERVLQTGSPLTVHFVVNSRSVEATINPDGSIFADSSLAIERLTGRTTR